MSSQRSHVGIEGIDHVALAVRDVGRSVEWYQRTLGLERRYQEAWGDRPAVVGIGTTAVALFEIGPNAPAAAAGAIGMRHLAFRTDGEQFAALQERFTRERVSFDFQDHAISCSIYLRDPDGYEIEITTYDIAI